MPTRPTKPAGPVPEELMNQLHEANDHFHRAREHLEAQMEGSEFRHQERVDNAAEKVRSAEREVEDASERIGQELRAQKPGEIGHAHEDGHGGDVADLEPLR